jgi:hypothetical protein
MNAAPQPLPPPGLLEPDTGPDVDPEEAMLEGGLVDPLEKRNPAEEEALTHLATGAKNAMACLVEQMDASCSGRTLLQLSKAAGHLHRLTMLFAPEDDYLLEGSPLLRRRMKSKRRMNRETAGVRMMQDVMSVVGQLAGKRSLSDDLRAIKAAKDAGMDDIVEALEKRVREQVQAGSQDVDFGTLGETASKFVAAAADDQEGFIDTGPYGGLAIYGDSDMSDGENFGLALPGEIEDDIDDTTGGYGIKCKVPF